MEEDMIGYMDWLIEAEDVDEEGNKRQLGEHLHSNINSQILTFVHTNLPLCVVEGAAIAKKKMMKKFGWYKHSEDGGGMIAAACCCYYFSFYVIISNSQYVCVHSAESDSDDDIAYLDDDSGFCASLM